MTPENSVIRVALLQLSSCGFDQDRALAIGLAACREAKTQGADVAVFPELWNIGYTPFSAEVSAPGFDPRDPRHTAAAQAWQDRAIGADAPWVEAHGRLAAELDMAILATFLERRPHGAPRNTAVLFDRRGRRVLTYAKVHLCSFSLEAWCAAGDTFPVTELDTAAGPVRVGVMICFDREFPEAARALTVGGAELILVPNACELEENRLGQIRTRAFENAVGITVANYAPPTETGTSVACSPIVFSPDGQTLDPWLVRAPTDAAGVFAASFDLTAMRIWRRREPWGLPARRPETYNVLTLCRAVE